MRIHLRHPFAIAVALLLTASVQPARRVLASSPALQGQSAGQSLTPLQFEIEKQRQRLSSGEVEERRDALMRLRSLEHPAAARASNGGPE